MSAGYRAKTASFASVGITDLTQASVDEGGQSYDLMGDASANVLDVFVDSIASDVTVSSNDVSIQANASLEIGDSGSLVIVFEKRATGKASAGADKTWTKTGTLLRKHFDAGTNGIGTGTYTFRCAGAGAWT